MNIHNIGEFWKKGHDSGTLGRSSYKLCNVHLHVIGIMCSKFHSGDLKSVGAV